MLELWVVKLLKVNIEKSWFDYRTQSAVIWQYIMCCPKFCPAQIFNSVLWKTQYICLSYGLWLWQRDGKWECESKVTSFIVITLHSGRIQWRHRMGVLRPSCRQAAINLVVTLVKFWAIFNQKSNSIHSTELLFAHSAFLYIF